MARKVLVVDDEAIILDLLEIILEKYDNDVTRAASGEQAVEILAAEGFDLVITDLHMGRISGLEVINAAKQTSQNTIAIMITGCCDKEYRTAAYNHGADAYLLKPFSIVDLLECIQLQELKQFYPPASAVDRGQEQLKVSA